MRRTKIVATLGPSSSDPDTLRRMLEAVGRRAVALRRVAMGPLRLGRLAPGESRVLSPEEIAALRRAVGLSDA